MGVLKQIPGRVSAQVLMMEKIKVAKNPIDDKRNSVDQVGCIVDGDR